MRRVRPFAPVLLATLAALAVACAPAEAPGAGDEATAPEVVAPAEDGSSPTDEAASDEAGSADGDAAPELDPDLTAEVVRTYADIVHASYADALAAAEAMDGRIDAFLAEPSEESLAPAKAAWIAAREVYGPTEAFRFYGGPIDDEATGPEGRINAWPLDEAYIDYVEGDPDAGIVNQADAHPELTAEALAALNEQGGEANVATGWHAIEFLLWGQDLSEAGPGERPATDYVVGEGPNAERRRAYLAAVSDLLLEDLRTLVAAWDPEGTDTYRAAFLAEDGHEALRRILTGIGSLAGAELAGERMYVAYETRDQEDEHSCFSDNTLADLVGNARGIEMVYLGRYGAIDGPGLGDLLATVDPETDEHLRGNLPEVVAAVEAIPAPFDQQIVADDGSPGRAAVLDAVEALEHLTEHIATAAGSLGVAIDVG